MLLIQRSCYHLNSEQRGCYHIVLIADLPDVGCKLSYKIEVSEMTRRTFLRVLPRCLHDRFVIGEHRE